MQTMATPEQQEVWRDRETIEELARPHYSYESDEGSIELPFHNWPHADYVTDKSLEIADNAERHGEQINVAVLVAAPPYHDADFFMKPGVDHPYSSKELQSSAVAQSDISLLGAPLEFVRHVGSAIESTQVGVKCTSQEARILRQADLSNITSWNPLVFLNGTYRLYKESKILSGQPLISFSLNPDAFIKDFVKFSGISYEILTAYNEEDISLGDFDRDRLGVSLFQKRAAKNIPMLVPKRITRILQSKLGDIVNYTPIGL